MAETALQKIQKLQEAIEAEKTAAVAELEARRTELEEQLAEVNRQLISLTGKMPAKRKRADGTEGEVYKCGRCGQFGHNARACTNAVVRT
jgi:DNA-binding transcriptional MerR regulator